ncbi:MAG: response regulator transcription factor [Acidobacteria bacterium]|nr:response regulator transcription factor [Acidobacteriota bacterium]
MGIRTLIVDDERLGRERLRQMLATEPDIILQGECRNGTEALEQLRARSADLVFLDVQMPELDGFRLMEVAPPECLPLVVFVTAYDEYALRAFEVGAVDYLLKPFDQARFTKTLERVRTRIGAADRPDLSAAFETVRRSRTSRLAVREGSRLTVVKTEAIDWVEAADNYVCLHCGPSTHVLRETLHSIEALLDGNTFVRIHRSIIVNLDRVKELQPWFRGDYRVILHDGTKLSMSRTFRERVQKQLLRWS